MGSVSRNTSSTVRLSEDVGVGPCHVPTPPVQVPIQARGRRRSPVANLKAKHFRHCHENSRHRTARQIANAHRSPNEARTRHIPSHYGGIEYGGLPVRYEYPWSWAPAIVEEFFDDLRGIKGRRQSTVRRCQNGLLVVAAGRPLFRSAEIRFNRATEFDDHRVPVAILRGRHFNAHPTLGHVVFVNIGFFCAIEANPHIAAKHLFAIESAARIDGEVIRWNVCVLILGHNGLR